MNPRPYQRECVDSIRDHYYNQQITCQGVAMCPAGGKTVIVSLLPRALPVILGESIVFIAHRDELINQAADKFRRYNPELTVEIERASERACPDADVVIASMQSMTPKRITKFDPSRFKVVICDEIHHSFQSRAYQDIFRYFEVHRSDASLSRRKLFIGLSATWRRGDGKGSEHLFDKIVYHRSMLDLMRSGIDVNGELCPYLAPVNCGRELTEISLDKVNISRTSKDFDISQLSQAVNTPERNEAIVDTYLERGEGLPAIAFTTDIQHSRDLAQAFCSRGIPFAAVTGDVKRNWREGGSMVRSDILEDYRKGLLRGVCSCDALTEGTDLPWAAVGLNASPCLSIVKYTQKFGRITRPFPAPEERLTAHQEGRQIPWVKPYGIWIDFTYSSTKHSLVQAPTLFGLRPDFQFKGKSVDETVKLIEEAKQKNPSIETRELRSLDDLTRSSVAFSSTAAPREDERLRKWSRYPWAVESAGQWALAIRGTNTVLRVRQDSEKAFTVWQYHMGAGSARGSLGTLKQAIEWAEKLLTKKERTILRRDAPWRREAPTSAQCVSLWYKDPEVKNKFRSGDAFFLFAGTEYQSGNMEYSKGAIADMLNCFLIANRVMPRSAKKSSWVQKAMAGVKARFSS